MLLVKKRRRPFSEKHGTEDRYRRRRGIRFRKTRCNAAIIAPVRNPFGISGRNAFCKKTPEDKMASETLRSIGTRASCHRRNRRGTRFRETEYEIGHRASPIREASEDSKSSDAFFFWKFGRPLVPSFPATARPGSGKVTANTRRHRLREASGPPYTDGLPVPKRKHGRPQKRSCTAPAPPLFGMRASVVFHRLAKLSLQRTKHRRDIPQHIRDPLFLLPVSSALQAAPDHFDIRPHIPFGTQSSIVPPLPRKAHDYVGQNTTTNPTQQDSRPERLTTLPPDALRAAPKRLGIRSHRPESPAGAASVALAHAAGISDTCSSAGTTRDRHRNNAAAGRSAIRGHGDELPQSVRFRFGNAIQKTDVPAAVPARSPDCRTAESCGP